MKLSSQLNIDYRTQSALQLPYRGLGGVEMILPGASTSCGLSCSCSCGTSKIKE